MQAARDRLGGGAGIGANMQIGGLDTLPQPARVGVDLDDLGVGIEIAALGRVMAEPGAGANHQVALGKKFAAEIGGKRAGDVERERVAVKETLCEQGRRQQRTAFLGQGFERLARARPDRTPPADHHRALGRGDHRGDLVDQCRVGRDRLRARHQIGRGRVVGKVGKRLLLQIERYAQHHRAALGAGDVERLADTVERPVDRADRDVMRSGPKRQRRLVDLLHVPGGIDRRVAGKDHDRRIAARRHGQRGHDLGEAGAAGDRGDADFARGAGIAVGHRDRAMLVAGVDQPRILIVGHRRRPIHVGVAHQGEQCVDTLGRESLRQDVGDLVVAHPVFPLAKKSCLSQPRNARHKIAPPRNSVAARPLSPDPLPAGRGEGGTRVTGRVRGSRRL